ncbi:MAG: class II aldolase/adducin family protein [Bacteroidales bacterium]|jgi:L-ribulose-5-phosphate 4-epimerase|nr:class II aldolase/adducin family protein [Bacteroidales bacterium]
MLFIEEKNKIISVLEDLLFYDLIDTGGGDISVRCNENKLITTPSGSAFRRWHVHTEDLVVLDLDGKIIEKGKYLGPGETPITLAIYNLFPNCNACIHSHTKYSLAFASKNKAIPSTINLMDILGEVPCLKAEDAKIKKEFKINDHTSIPEGMIQRPDVAEIFISYIIPQLKTKFLPRKKELEKHGLAFTIYKHGVFVFARNLDEAFENLMRVEASARNYILSQEL